MVVWSGPTEAEWLPFFLEGGRGRQGGGFRASSVLAVEPRVGQTGTLFPAPGCSHAEHISQERGAAQASGRLTPRLGNEGRKQRSPSWLCSQALGSCWAQPGPAQVCSGMGAGLCFNRCPGDGCPQPSPGPRTDLGSSARGRCTMILGVPCRADAP